MPKQAERDYLKNIGPDAVRHAVGRPFADPDCARSLMELGTIATQLPRPPARLLDLGCGTGWTSVFLARMGYEVVGVDISADMIAHARRQAAGLDNLRFEVTDYEELPYVSEFDAAVFYAALHHAQDEHLALVKTYRALRPGGICVTCEPGQGHAAAPLSRAAVAQFGVTEKDMPPRRIMALAKQAGFTQFLMLPAPYELAAQFALEPRPGAIWLTRIPLLRRLIQAGRLLRFLGAVDLRGGIVVLKK